MAQRTYEPVIDLDPQRDLGTDYGGEALPEGRWIVLQANADAIAGPSDRAILKEIGATGNGDDPYGLGRYGRDTASRLKDTSFEVDALSLTRATA